MYYRRDIDGLRAAAVVPVVLFHAGVPGFSGGFVGVDVFFVISGYLITALIAEEIRNERFSIVTFYERRVRRIFPALIAVLVASAALATMLLFPSQFRIFARSVVAAMLFSSNILFWLKTGYFAPPTGGQALLHTWSLAVEEQFYIVFPVMLFLVHRWLSGRWIAWLAPLAILSFVVSVWGVTHAPTATFYLAPTRAWELLLGSLLALHAFPRLPSRPLMEVMAVVGLAAIAWAVVTLSGSSPFPGANALFPCLGTALVIYSGEVTPTYVKRLLGLPPLVFIGLISYSLYLWHWPLLVFARLWSGGELTASGTVGVIAISSAAAVLSWQFVEKPFRGPGRTLTRRQLFTFAGAASVVLVAFGSYGYFSQGWPRRLPAEVARIDAYSFSYDRRADDCTSVPGHLVPPSLACIFGASVPPSFAVWGDSHAGALVGAIGDLAKRHRAAVVFLGSSSCPPLLGVERTDPSYACAAENDKSMKFLLASKSITTVMLISRYALYVEGWSDALGPAERESNELPYITDNSGAVLGAQDRRSLLKTALARTVATLLNAEEKWCSSIRSQRSATTFHRH